MSKMKSVPGGGGSKKLRLSYFEVVCVTVRRRESVMSLYGGLFYPRLHRMFMNKENPSEREKPEWKTFYLGQAKNTRLDHFFVRHSSPGRH